MRDELPADSATTMADAHSIGAIELAPALDDLAEDWNRLAGASPFLSYEWLSAWWRHFGAQQELFTLAVRNQAGELVAIAPWRLESTPAQGREIRFLGDGAVCSDYLTLLCRPEYAVAAATALADWLSGPAAGLWDSIEWAGVAADDPVMRRLTAMLAEAGHAHAIQSDAQCWRIGLPADWDAFLAGLSASRRQKTRALLRNNVDNDRIQIRRVANRDELATAFASLVDLHTRRRRSLGQEGCFATPKFTEFLREASEGLLASDRLRMFWLELDGRPIAVELGLIAGDAIYYYQGGFDPDVAAERPGWIAFANSPRKLRSVKRFQARWEKDPDVALGRLSS